MASSGCTHWLTATTFLVLAVSGLNITFGKFVIQPWMGDAMFGPWVAVREVRTQLPVVPVHAGLVLMLLIWIKDNIPNGRDITWFKMAAA